MGKYKCSSNAVIAAELETTFGVREFSKQVV